MEAQWAGKQLIDREFAQHVQGFEFNAYYKIFKNKAKQNKTVRK